MSTFYEDNMNIKKINGFTLQQVSRDVWAIDEFGIDIMYLIIGTERALLNTIMKQAWNLMHQLWVTLR